MLGQNLNGMVLDAIPVSQDGYYRFRVVEHYYGQGRAGKDLTVRHSVSIHEKNFRFQQSGSVYKMLVKPSAFSSLEKAVVEKGVSEVVVYPVFEVNRVRDKRGRGLCTSPATVTTGS